MRVFGRGLKRTLTIHPRRHWTTPGIATTSRRKRTRWSCSTQQRALFVKSLPHLRDHTREHLELLSVHRRIGAMRQGHRIHLVHLLVEGVESVRADRGRLLKDGKIQSTALASDRGGLSGDEQK